MEELDAILKNSHRPTDLLFSCTSGGRGLHVQTWDLHNGGTLRTYRCDGEGEGLCLCMAGKDYLLCALKAKPIVLIWKIDKEQVHMRFACSGPVSHMVCDTTGTYCIASIGEKINVWEVCSGSLLAQLSRHYQPVSTLYYIEGGGGYFASGGRDGLTIVWNIGSVLSEHRLSQTISDPLAPQIQNNTKNSIRHIWSSHSMPITCILSTGHASCMKILTSSLDHSCKFFDFSSGDLLCTFLYNAPLTSLTLSLTGLWLYVGCSSGTVVAVSLSLPSEKKVKEIGENSKFASILKGHKKPVTSLIMSSSGNYLISSSEDCQSKVWDVDSNQVILTISSKGPVVSTLLRQDVWRFSQLQSTCTPYCPSLPLKAFQKQLHYKHNTITDHTITLPKRPIHMLSSDKIRQIDLLSGEDVIKPFYFQTERTITTEEEEDLESEVNTLRQELSEMKEVHRSIYSLAIEHLLTGNI